jgi:hypothetical protein
MASLDSLPGDQRAVLQLVLQRGRTYDEIAQLLSIDRAAVRDRALAAFDALGPQTRVAPERRALITDYLLAQLPPRVSDEVRDRLAASASERAWARVLASELVPLATSPLPEIPLEAAPGEPVPGEKPVLGVVHQQASARAGSEPAADTPDVAAAAAGAEKRPPAPETNRREPPRPNDRPRSRAGGAILLAGGALIVVVVVVVVLLVSGGSNPSHHRTSAAATSPSATSTATTSRSSAHIVAQIKLTSPDAHSKAAGLADVLKQGTNSGVAIVAQGLAANAKHPPNAYAVWLYNSPADSHILGFVNPAVGANGRLSTAGGLPANAARYKQLILTLETQATPHQPGQIILQGQLTGL